MRSNLIGNTIFLTSEKYCLTNQTPDTIFFTSEKIRIGFSHLSGRSCEVIESECVQRSLLYQNHGFKVCRHRFSGTIYRGPRKRNLTRKKTQQNVALLKEFLTLRNESRLIEETPPKEVNAYIAKFIITVRKKESNEYYELSSSRSLMASFEWKKNYRCSIMKDAEFEQACELSTVSECSTRTLVHSAGSGADYQQRPGSNVKLYQCCYLWWSIQHLYQQLYDQSQRP